MSKQRFPEGKRTGHTLRSDQPSTQTSLTSETMEMALG
jgi:hypothetical protein